MCLLNTLTATILHISKVNSIENNQIVTLSAKVTNILPSKTIESYQGKKYTIQEVYIADTTGHTMLSLFENYIDQVKLDESYQFKNIRTCKLSGETCLQTVQDITTITPITSLQQVQAPEFDPQELINTVATMDVIGLDYAKSVKICAKCKATISDLDIKVTCGKCSTIQPTKRCKTRMAARVQF